MVQSFLKKIHYEKTKQAFWDGSGGKERVWDNFSYKMECAGPSNSCSLNIDQIIIKFSSNILRWKHTQYV